jgi:hypothetical protein
VRQDFPDRDVHDFDGDGVGADVDCDDTDPKNVEVAVLLYIDADGDGTAATRRSRRVIPEQCGQVRGDCDDTDAANFVGNEEVCDQRDNDCDDDIDEGAPALPEEFEVCGDEIDTNCDGSCGDCCFGGDNVVTDAPFALFSTAAFGSLGRAVVATDVSETTASFAAGAPREEVVFLVPAATVGGKSSRIDVDDPTSRKVLGVVHGSTKNSYFGTALAAIDGGGILVGAPGAQEVVGKDITNGAVYRIGADVTAGSELGVDASDVVLYATGGTDPTSSARRSFQAQTSVANPTRSRTSS